MTSAPLIAVLDYGIGNLRSAQKALQRVGADARLTTSGAEAAAADAVVLPGVGAFGACMDALREAGLEEVVHDAVASGRPFLGICVGMQMLFSASDESPQVSGLNIIEGHVKWIPSTLPRPQMQWNQLTITRDDPILRGLGEAPWMYFVHSLHGVPNDPSHVVATTHYGEDLNVAFRKGNVFATQFHPEKSAASGLHLLQNFVSQVSAS
jgi:glutamine amidotransferase